MWVAVWKVLQPEPKHTSGMVCTLTSPRISVSSPKSGEKFVVVIVWVCGHMPSKTNYGAQILTKLHAVDMPIVCPNHIIIDLVGQF